MPAKKPAKKAPRKASGVRAKATPKETRLEKGFEDFGEEMGKLGERIGEAFEKKGRGWERSEERCGGWFRRTFGLAGPLLSSILGIVIFSLLIWVIGFVNGIVQTGLLFNIQVFLQANLGLFFLFFLFFSYASYFSKEYKAAYRPVSPVFAAAGFTIGFWMVAKAIAVANISLGLQTLTRIHTYIESSLLMIFWVLLVIGYLVLLARLACCRSSACCERGGIAMHEKTEKEVPSSSGGGTKRLYRSGRDRILGGVCGGIAEYLGVDPVIIRILWVIGTLAWGLGILLYIILWIIIPRNPNHKWK